MTLLFTVTTLVCSLASTILLGLVIMGIPFIKPWSLDIVEADFGAGGVSGTIRIGVLSYCADTCTPARLWYPFDLTALNTSFSFVNVPIPSWVTVPLSAHVIAGIFSVLLLINSLSTTIHQYRKPNDRNIISCCDSLAAICTCIITLGAFIYDIVFYTIADQAKKDGAFGTAINVSVRIGLGTWLTLAATIFLLVAVALNMCSGCRNPSRSRAAAVRRERDLEDWSADDEQPMLMNTRQTQYQPVATNIAPPAHHDADEEESAEIDPDRKSRVPSQYGYGYGSGMDVGYPTDRKSQVELDRQSSISRYSQASISPSKDVFGPDRFQRHSTIMEESETPNVGTFGEANASTSHTRQTSYQGKNFRMVESPTDDRHSTYTDGLPDYQTYPPSVIHR